MPAGLGSRAVRNFVKEFIHKQTCGSSLERTATINGDVFDASSGVYRGATNYATVVAAGVDAFTPQNIDVGVLGVTSSVDVMPTDGTNNLLGTFRIGDATGMRKGSVVHVVESTGAITTAAGSITFALVAPAPGNVTITLTNVATGVVSASAALGIPAGTANASAASLTTAINLDATISPLVVATNPGAPSAIVVLTPIQSGVLGNMTVGTADVGLAPQGTTPVNLTGGTPNVGTAILAHVHRSGSISIGSWVTDPNFTFPAGAIVVASASGSPDDAMVDTKVSSSSGDSAVSGQYIAALLNDLMAQSVGGGTNLPITNCVAGTLSVTAFTVGPLDTNLTTNAFVGNTLTFTDAAPTAAGLQGFSTVIVANNGANLLTVDPPLPILPVATDDFVITPTQISPFTDQLLASPGDSGRALVGGLPIGAITEGPNTGAPANNSNVAPVPALAMMASFKFGECMTGGAGTSVEPNFMLSSELLSDLAGAGLTLDGFPSYPLVANYTAADPSFSIRLPVNVGDRSFPRSGLLRMRADSTTPPVVVEAPPFVVVQGTRPIPSAAALPFTRGPVNAAGEALITLTGATVAVNVSAGARVFIETAAMNGPKKHGFQGEVKSYDWLSVLSSVLSNWLTYTIPGE